MSRLGEGRLFASTQTLGSAWVKSISTRTSFHPRLVIDAGCQLIEIREQQGIQSFPREKFSILNLGGQLHWDRNNGPVVGFLSHFDYIDELSSRPHPEELRFNIYCELPFLTLTRLEEQRAGGPTVFFLQLSGSWLFSDGSVEKLHAEPIRFNVPSPQWLTFLSEVGYDKFDILEVRGEQRWS